MSSLLFKPNHIVSSFLAALEAEGAEVARAAEAVNSGALLGCPVVWDDWLQAAPFLVKCGQYRYSMAFGCLTSHDGIALNPYLPAIAPGLPPLLIIREVFLHELAHGLAPLDDHGPKWAEMTDRIGLVCPGEAQLPLRTIGKRAEKEKRRWAAR